MCEVREGKKQERGGLAADCWNYPLYLWGIRRSVSGRPRVEEVKIIAEAPTRVQSAHTFFLFFFIFFLVEPRKARAHCPVCMREDGVAARRFLSCVHPSVERNQKKMYARRLFFSVLCLNKSILLFAYFFYLVLLCFCGSPCGGKEKTAVFSNMPNRPSNEEKRKERREGRW